MRHLVYCETWNTDHHEDAWIVLAEMSAFVRDQEARRRATIVSIDLCMDDAAHYYGHVVLEAPTLVKVPEGLLIP